MNAMTEYARLAEAHKALDTLVSLRLLTQDESVRLMRKFIDDRPEFKKHVAEAMGSRSTPSTTGA